MLLDALEQHGGLQVYQEGSEAVMRDFRLISMDRLREVKDSAEASGVVIKPLTDSQWVDRLLTNIDGSRAVWMFRGWADVVNSSAVKWPGHGADIVAAFRRGDDRWLGWRSERIEPATRARFEALSAHCEDGDDHGAWAAWWWLRNQHFFDQGLDAAPEFVRPVPYESLVSAPQQWLAALCAFAGFPAPPGRDGGVHPRSVRKSSPPAVPDPVAAACDGLLRALQASAQRSWPELC